jgi:hypothetical protein
MDDATLGVFKLKFIKLTIILNFVLLLFAFAVITYFKIIPGLNLPVSLLFAVAGLVLLAYFWKSYKKEKQWLHEQP